MPAVIPFGYVYEPDAALFAEDEEDAPMEDPDADPGAEPFHDTAEELQARGSTPAPPGSSVPLAARRDLRGVPLASPEMAQTMDNFIQFLRDDGVNPSELTGSYGDLVRLSASRLGDKRSRERSEDVDDAGRNDKFRRGAEDGQRRCD